MKRLENLTEEERENLPKIFAQPGLFSPIFRCCFNDRPEVDGQNGRS